MFKSNFKDLKYLFFAIVILFSLLFVIAHKMLLTKGVILNGDTMFPLHVKDYIYLIYPLWNIKGSMPNFGELSKLIIMYPYYKLALLLNISTGSFGKGIILGALFVASVSAYYASSTLLRGAYKKINGKFVFIASMISALTYMLNPWAMDRIIHWGLLISYGFMPLFLIMYIKSLETNKIKYAIATAFLWCLVSFSPHYVIFGGFFIFLWLLFSMFFDIRNGHMLKLYKNIKTTILITLFYMAFSAYWIMPYIVSSFISFIGPPSNWLFTQESVDGLSRLSNLVNVFRLLGYSWPLVSYEPYSDTLRIPWLFSSFIIPVTAFLALILRPKDKNVWFFSLVSIVLISMGAGTRGPISSIYLWLCFDTPISNVFGWYIRDPNKWVGLLALTYSLLISITVYELLQKKWTKINFSVIFTNKTCTVKLNSVICTFIPIILILSFLLYVSPTVTGYFNDIYDPVKVPQEYYTVNEWLANETDEFKVMWLSHYLEGKTTWNPNLPARIEYMSSAKPTFRPAFAYMYYYYQYIYPNLLKSGGINYSKYFDFLGVRYIIIINDIEGAEKLVEQEIKVIKEQKDLEFVKQEGFMYVFENKKYASQVFVPLQNSLVLGGLDAFSSLSSIKKFKPSKSSLLFLEQKPYKAENILSFTSISDNIILYNKNSLDDIALSFLDDKYTIAPFEHTNQQDFRRGWGKINIYIIEQWPHTVSQEYKGWDFDYGKGHVFTITSARSDLNMTINIEKTDTYHLYARYFQNHNGGYISIKIDGVNIGGIHTKKQSQEGFKWKKINTITLDKGKHIITLQNEKGFNAVNMLALIPSEKIKEYVDNAYKLADKLRNIYVLEAESSFNYKNARSNGQAMILKSISELSVSIDILKENSKYQIAINALTCPDCKPITLEIGNKEYNINLNNSKEEQRLIYLEPIKLQRGSYQLKIKSAERAEIDNIIIYSTNGNETLEDIFTSNETPASVTYEMIDPTKYIARVNASRPFMLAFAEAYDPMWIAHSDDYFTRSIPLYSVINGFYINKTGNYDLLIEFEPQKWFYVGMWITIISLIGSVVIVIMKWRKEKNEHKN